MGIEGHVRESASGLGRREKLTPEQTQQKMAEAAEKAKAQRGKEAPSHGGKRS